MLHSQQGSCVLHLLRAAALQLRAPGGLHHVWCVATGCRVQPNSLKGQNADMVVDMVAYSTASDTIQTYSSQSSIREAHATAARASHDIGTAPAPSTNISAQRPLVPDVGGMHTSQPCATSSIKYSTQNLAYAYSPNVAYILSDDTSHDKDGLSAGSAPYGPQVLATTSAVMVHCQQSAPLLPCTSSNSSSSYSTCISSSSGTTNDFGSHSSSHGSNSSGCSSCSSSSSMSGSNSANSTISCQCTNSSSSSSSLHHQRLPAGNPASAYGTLRYTSNTHCARPATTISSGGAVGGVCARSYASTSSKRHHGKPAKAVHRCNRKTNKVSGAVQAELINLLVEYEISRQQAKNIVHACMRMAQVQGAGHLHHRNWSNWLRYLQSKQVTPSAALSNFPAILINRFQQNNANAVVAILSGRLGATAADVAVILTHPSILFIPSTTVNAAVSCLFNRLECTATDLLHMARNNASIFGLQQDTFIEKVNWLLSKGFNRVQLLGFCKHSSLLTCSVERTLEPNFQGMVSICLDISQSFDEAQALARACLKVKQRLITTQVNSPQVRSRKAYYMERLSHMYSHWPVSLGLVLGYRLAWRTAPRFALLEALDMSPPKHILNVLMSSDAKWAQMLAHCYHTGQPLTDRRKLSDPTAAWSMLNKALSHPDYSTTVLQVLHQPQFEELSTAGETGSINPDRVMPLFTQVYHATPEGQRWLMMEQGDGNDNTPCHHGDSHQ